MVGKGTYHSKYAWALSPSQSSFAFQGCQSEGEPDKFNET